MFTAVKIYYCSEKELRFITIWLVNAKGFRLCFPVITVRRDTVISFVDSYMRDMNNYNIDDSELDEQKILIKSITGVLPKILEYELTEKQRLCIKLFYLQGKSQTEIARQLRLSQPTVSRHINSAKTILNKFIGYCFYSVKKANDQWLSLQ